MRRMRKRRWEESQDDDPGAGLLNLFDVWIAFAAALLLALVGARQISAEQARQDSSKESAEENKEHLESIQQQKVKMERYKVSDKKLRGEGERLGTAYRLQSGEVIYVPDGK